MDNREKFNIKQMVDCEKQEPFYPVTHAEAVKIIDNGEVKNLQDILSTVLNFIENFAGIELHTLQLGYTHDDAFYGDQGKTLWDSLYPLSTEVVQNDQKPVTGGAIYSYIEDFRPSGEINSVNENTVSGKTIYNYINSLIGGQIASDDTHLVSGSTVYNYVNNLQPNGVVQSGDTRPVSGDTVFTALSQLQDSFWETDSNYIGSIKQKPAEDQQLNLEVSKNNEIALGNNNISNDNTIFSIGNGAQNNRSNVLEVTSDNSNSLKVPFNNQYVSIQGHMRNEQEDIKHLTSAQLEKLNRLISINLVPKIHFVVETTESEFYNLNRGISVTWGLYNSMGESDNVIGELNLNKSNITIYSSSNSFEEFRIVDYSNSAYNNSPFNFNTNGHTTFNFSLVGNTTEIQPVNEFRTINLYAPSFVFCSTESDLSSIPQGSSQIVYAKSLTDFKSEFTIPGQDRQYIYIAVPTFMNLSNPNYNQPFKDRETGIEFSLSQEFYRNTTVDFNIANSRQVTVYYNIVRSDQLLDSNVNWYIVHK